MRRKWKKICMCITVGCLWILSGCNSKEKEAETLTEIASLKEETDQEAEKDSEDESTVICVHVCGQVKSPGVYELKKDSRLYEAVEAAGGMTDTAADTYLNQAESLKDGQQIYVPSKQEVQDKKKDEQISMPSGEADDGKLDINTASKEELMTLSGIGEAKADAIIRYREEKGRFRSAEELKEVEGIKDGIYNKVKDQIKVS